MGTIANTLEKVEKEKTEEQRIIEQQIKDRINQSMKIAKNEKEKTLGDKIKDRFSKKKKRKYTTQRDREEFQEIINLDDLWYDLVSDYFDWLYEYSGKPKMTDTKKKKVSKAISEFINYKIPVLKEDTPEKKFLFVFSLAHIPALKGFFKHFKEDMQDKNLFSKFRKKSEIENEIN